MLGNLPLRAKLVTYGIALSIIPLCIVAGTTFYQANQMTTISDREMNRMSTESLDYIVKGVYDMCKAQMEMIQENVNHALNVAREVLNNTGKVNISDETIDWTIVNQYTKSAQTITLPKFRAGEQWLGNNTNMHEPSLIVDKVKNMVGGTCTIFQRINDAGDMLRVSTNVVKKDGQRAIGTFIPRKNPDGQDNPVISAVLQGKTFHGRAYVVDRWYITAYEPIFGETHEIMGMLYVGIAQENVKSLRQAIVNTTIGKTGYIYVLDSQGNYVISRNDERDGTNVLNIKDANGDYPIQEIIRKALPLTTNQIAEHAYYWQNSDDPKPRLRIARIVYFKDWDWIIGAGVYKDEFRQSQNQIARINRTNYMVLISVIVMTTIITMIVWRLVAGSIVQPIRKSVELAAAMANGDFTQKVCVHQKNEIGVLADALNKMTESIKSMIGNLSNGVTTLTTSATDLSAIAKQMNQSSEGTARQCRTVAVAAEQMSTNMTSVATASEQAATNVQMVASAAEEMSATLNEIAQNSDNARSITDKTVHKAMSATQKVNELGGAAEEISKVTEVITEISEQTNLLALNATIEAARAGEAGKGFAVVANEIKELANQTAAATSEIKRKIEGIQQATGSTVTEIEEISVVIKDINDIVSTIASAVEEQSTTTQEIAQNVLQAAEGIQSVNQNINQSSQGSAEIAEEINNVNQANGEINAGSSQVLNASVELSSLAEKLNLLVGQFKIT